MGVFEVTSPDGKVYEVEGANAQGALAALMKHLGGSAPAAQPAPQPEAFDALGNPTGTAAPVVATASMPFGEQMANVGSTLDKGVRMAANGATFGLADKFAGGMDAVTGQAPSYDAGVKAQRAKTEEVRKASPAGAAVAEAAGGLASGAGLIKNGVTLAGRVGPGLLSRVLGYGIEGAAYGGAHGAGNTYSDKLGDYVDHAKTAAATGLVVGGGLPLAGSAAGSIYRTGSAFLGPRVADAGRGASTMLRAAAQADEAGLRALPSMGPDGMLVDAGPSLLGLGQGAGTGTGEGRTQLVNALMNRDRGTGQRLAQTLDSELGAAPIPSRVEAGLHGERKALSPEYEAAFNDAKAVDTQSIVNKIDEMIPNVRGDARSQLMRARDDLHITDAAGNTGIPDPHPRTLLAVRQSLDGAIQDATNPNVQRVLGDVRKLVDAELAAKVPGIKAVDAKWAELKKQSEALERGGQVFDSGRGTVVRPAELTADMGGMSAGQQQRLREGARAEVDRLVGTNVNDLNVLERKLGTPQDWNSQKFGQVFGEDPRDAVVKALMDNRKFRDSYQKIVQNSQTAQRTSAANAMDGAPGGNVPHDATLTGLGFKAINALAKAVSGASGAATKDEIGRILAKQGPEAQALGRELLSSAQTTGERSRAIARLLSSPRWIGATGPAEGRR